MKILLVLLYLAAVVLANLSVAHFGPSATIVNALVFIGLDLTSRDALQDWWGKRTPLYMLLLILAGGALSWVLNAGAARIALASTVAFVASQGLAAVLYAFVRRWPWLGRANTANALGALVDSLVFPSLAFGAFLPVIVLGQFLAKLVGGFLWSLILKPWRPA